MKHVLVVLALAMLLTPGCALLHAHSDEYKDSCKEAVRVSEALETNATRVAENNIILIANDTSRLVEAGEMTAEERTKVIEKAKEQATNVKKQALFIKAFCLLAKEESRDVDISESIKGLLENLNNTLPELEKFVDKLEEMCK